MRFASTIATAARAAAAASVAAATASGRTRGSPESATASGELRDVGGDSCDLERRLGGGGEGLADLPVALLRRQRGRAVADRECLVVDVGVELGERRRAGAQRIGLRRDAACLVPRLRRRARRHADDAPPPSRR